MGHQPKGTEITVSAVTVQMFVSSIGYFSNHNQESTQMKWNLC